MSEVVNRRLNIFIDAAGAEEALGRLTKKEQQLLTQIEKLEKAGKDTTKEMQKLAATRQQIGQLGDVLSGKVLPSIRQAEAAVSKLNRELKALPAGSDAAKKKFLELKSAVSTLERVRNEVGGVNKAMSELGKGRGLKNILDSAAGFFIGGGLLGAVNSLGTALESFFSGSLEEALKGEKAYSRLKATLDNLGRTDAFDRLKNEAIKLSEAFGFFGDDDVIEVFEQLINYGKLTEKQMKELTPVIIDFAAKSQIEFPEAASVIIKALEGNGKALKEYGIDIKDAKDETEAFGVIMEQLKPKVEGAAEAFGNTTAGQIAKTREDINRLKGEIGDELLPIVKSFYSFISGALTGLNTLVSNIRVAGDRSKFSVIDRIKLLTGDPTVTARVNLERFLQEQAQKRQSQVQAGTATDQILGTGGKSTPKADTGAKKATDDLEALRKKYLEFAANIRGERLDNEYGEVFAAFRKINDEAQKDLAQLGEFVRKGIVSREDAQELTDAIADILDAQRAKLRERFKLDPVQIPVQLVDPAGTTAEDAEAFGKKLFADLANGLQAQERDRIAGLELDVLRSFGKRQLDAQKALLQSQRDAELENTELTEQEKALIKERYRQEEMRLEMDFWMGLTDVILQFASQFTEIIGNINQIRTNNENAAFEQEVANNEKRKDSAKKLLDARAITQKEYDRRIAKIEAEQEKRRLDLVTKQFERDKKAQTAQALINGAQAALATIARFGAPIPPNFLGIAAMALTLATSATQIAAIRSAKPPKFEQGGFIPQGSSHKQGGISLVDNRTGANLGEIEGGEPIISRKVYARNKPLIDSLLNPAWQNAPVQSINIPRINSSMQRMYQDGGILPQAGTGSNEEMMALLRALNQRLSEPLRSFTVYGDYEVKANKINAIRNSGVIR